MKNVFRIFVLVLFAGLLAFGYIAGNTINSSFMQVTSNAMTGIGVTETVWANAGFSKEAFDRDYKTEEIVLTSSQDGHDIPAVYINAGEEKDHEKDTVILVHELGANKECMYPAAQMFLKNNLNVVVFDLRSHGENAAKYTTFGYLEKFDVLDLMEYVKRENGGHKTGIYAQSYGALAACQAAGYEQSWQQLDFLILDSPIRDLSSQLKESLTSVDSSIARSLLYFTGNLVNRMKLGFFYSDASAIKAMKKVNMPVLVITSEADTAVPAEHAKDVYNAIPGSGKKLWTVQDSEHLQILTDHAEEYEQKVMAFIYR